MFSRMFLWVRSHVSTLAFVFGFVGDALTLKRIDLVYENFVFLSYLLIALGGILLIHAVDTRRITRERLSRLRPWLPAMVQIPIGGLFSGFVIFYSKSASLLTSWPFLLLLVGVFVGNEFFHKRYERLVFQISVFYGVLLMYLVLIVPTILGRVGTPAFLFAGFLSLVGIVLILRLIVRLFPRVYHTAAHAIMLSVGGIYLAINILYFTNIIPPVPLALKEIGVYHSVVRTGGAYQVVYEEPLWYEVWRTTGYVYHRTQNEAAYCFSSVFAPTLLKANIYHVWEKKNEEGSWIRESRIPFAIQGGRDGGYRGYTIKQSLTAGDWRCIVETARGQTIGHTSFRVEDVDDLTGRVSGER